MCTSILIQTENKEYITARTLDFHYPLDGAPIFIPRNHTFLSQADGSKWQTKYGFIGAGSEMEGQYSVIDGVNEHGLAVAELYLPGEVQYQPYDDGEGMLNFAAQDFILWLLGNCASIEEIEQQLPKINIVGTPVPILNIVTPLHWIITDDQGRCVVIEPTEKTLHLKENPVKTMTNTPQLEWHIENLRNYLHVRPEQYPAQNFGTFKATPFSQGTGTSGLPGGYTPPERFVRAAFFREHTHPGKDEQSGVNAAFHILDTVSIPKGIVQTAEGQCDYTQLKSAMCNTTRSFYFSSYEDHQVVKVALTDHLLATDQPYIFDYPSQKEGIRVLRQTNTATSAS